MLNTDHGVKYVYIRKIVIYIYRCERMREGMRQKKISGVKKTVRAWASNWNTREVICFPLDDYIERIFMVGLPHP